MITTACELGLHQVCYKGQGPGLDARYHWCTCYCHPTPEPRRSWWQRLIGGRK